MSSAKYKIEFDENEKITQYTNKAPVGQLMVLLENPCEGEILLRAYDRIVSLTNPDNVWNESVPLEVRFLEPGEVIKLTAK